jgi:hypothetical protein
MLETIGIFAIIGGIIAAIAYYIESNQKYQRYYQARADVMQIVKIIEKYHATYGEYLIVEKNIDEQPGGILVNILAAVHTPSGHPLYPEVVEHNPKMINFAGALMGRRTLNDRIVDPWGEPYHIAIDTNGDGAVELVWKTFTHDYKPIDDLVLRIYRPVIAWSNGPDKRNHLGFGDDICSWHSY